MNSRQKYFLPAVCILTAFLCVVLFLYGRYVAGILSAVAGIIYAARVILLFQFLGSGRPNGTILRMIVKVVGLYVIGLLITAMVVILIMKPNI